MGRIATLTALMAFLASCVATGPPSLHHSSGLRADRAYLCLAPNGALAREIFEPTGSVTCPAPARYVSQPFCEKVPAPPRDNLGYERARASAARDGTLDGDSFEGQPFCAVPKGGPAPPLG